MGLPPFEKCAAEVSIQTKLKTATPLPPPPFEKVYIYNLHALMLIVHRDLKPQNILLMWDRNEPYDIGAKITDFGLSKEAPDGSASLSVEQRHSTGWTAPEILDDRTFVKGCTYVSILYNPLAGSQVPYCYYC